MTVIKSLYVYLLFVSVSHITTCAHGSTVATVGTDIATGGVATSITTNGGTTQVTTMTTTTPATTTGQVTTGPATTGPATTGPATTGPATTGQPVKPTTGTPLTVKPPSTQVGNWTIKDKDGKVCMQMSFAFQMNVSYTKHDNTEGKVVVNAIPKQVDVTSDCAQDKRVMTIYPFTRLDKGWKIDLTFQKTSRTFALTNVGLAWNYDGRFVDSSLFGFGFENSGTDNFLDTAVTLGKCYECTKPLVVSTGSASLQLSDMKLQPFAEKSGGNFGDAESCKTGNLAVIIGATVGAIVLIVVLVVVVLVVVKRRKKASAPYSNF